MSGGPAPQAVESGVIVGAKGEVKDIDIGLDSLLVSGLWNGDHSMLDVPAQNALCGCLAVSRGKLAQQRVVQVCSLERTAAFKDDATSTAVFKPLTIEDEGGSI